MHERKRTCNTCIVPEAGWPQVHNLTAMDKLLFAGTMVFSSASSNTSHSQPSVHTCNSHTSHSQPSVHTCVDPVDVAISWLQRESESYRRDMKLLERFRIPPPVPEDDRLPPTLPFRMRGRVGVHDYELQDKEDQRTRIVRLKAWRNRNRAKKYDMRTNEAMERKKVEISGNNTNDLARGIKRKSEDDSSRVIETGLRRPKRCRIPNSKYDSAIFVLTPPSRCSQVVPSSPERRSQ